MLLVYLCSSSLYYVWPKELSQKEILNRGLIFFKRGWVWKLIFFLPVPSSFLLERVCEKCLVQHWCSLNAAECSSSQMGNWLFCTCLGTEGKPIPHAVLYYVSLCNHRICDICQFVFCSVGFLFVHVCFASFGSVIDWGERCISDLLFLANRHVVVSYWLRLLTRFNATSIRIRITALEYKTIHSSSSSMFQIFYHFSSFKDQSLSGRMKRILWIGVWKCQSLPIKGP